MTKLLWGHWFKAFAIAAVLFSALTMLLIHHLKSDRADSASYYFKSLCEQEAARERRSVLTMRINQTQEGQWYTELRLRSLNSFDYYWFTPYISPPIEGHEEQQLFALNDQELTFRTRLSNHSSITIGRHAGSFAFISNDRTSDIQPSRITGLFPLDAGAEVIQVAGSELENGTHFAFSGDEHAVDLETEVGSDVVAFAAGRVVYVEQDYHDEYACGLKHAARNANMIAILQDDGLEAIYGHLQRGSALVEEGQRVSSGDRLAKVGCLNGCRNGAHLHFQVGGMTETGLHSVPVAFRTGENRIVITPRVSEYIRP